MAKQSELRKYLSYSMPHEQSVIILNLHDLELQDLIKLNKQLTAENTKFLIDIEGITSDKNTAENNYNKLKSQFDFLRSERDLHLDRYENEVHLKCNERIIRKDLSKELEAIKSKWRYRLFKFLGL